MIFSPLMVALLAAPATRGLIVEGAPLGRPITLASLQAKFPSAQCDALPVSGGLGKWWTCRVPMRFAGRHVIAVWAIQPDGNLHAVEFPLPSAAFSAAKAAFERQCGCALETRRAGEMRYFGVCRHTALAVFSRGPDELYITYTWLQGSSKLEESCP